MFHFKHLNWLKKKKKVVRAYSPQKYSVTDLKKKLDYSSKNHSVASVKKKAKFFTDIIRHLLLFLYILAMLLEPQSYSLFYDAAAELIQSVFPSVDFICHGRNLNSRKIFLL